MELPANFLSLGRGSVNLGVMPDNPEYKRKGSNLRVMPENAK